MKRRLDKRRQELEALRDEVNFSILMDEYADKMGEAVRAEAEEAFASGKISMPQSADNAFAAAMKRAAKESREKKPMKALARYGLTAAATIVILFSTLLAVRAAGVNVFGALTRWTDDFFYVNADTAVTDRPEDSDSTEPLQDLRVELMLHDVPMEYAPTWIPERFTPFDLEVSPIDAFFEIHALYLAQDETNVSMLIRSGAEGTVSLYPKNEDPPEEYTVCGKTFSVFQNKERWVAVWTDGSDSISIFGDISKEEMLQILQSYEAYWP